MIIHFNLKFYRILTFKVRYLKSKRYFYLRFIAQSSIVQRIVSYNQMTMVKRILKTERARFVN